jgi:integrase
VPVETQAETVAQLAGFLDELSLQDVTPKYRREVAQRLRAFADFLDGDPVSAQAAKRFLAELRDRGRAPATVRMYYHAVRPFLAYLGVAFTLKLRHRRRLPAYHSAQDLDAILDAIDRRRDNWARLKGRDRLIVLTLALTGLRVSELASLRRSDVCTGFVRVRRGKGDRDRVVPITGDLDELLAPHLALLHRHARVFGIKPRQLYNVVTRYALAAGITDLTPHGLRHFFATALVERGAPLKAVQELLGHASIQTTAVYLDLVPGHLRSAVALLSSVSGSASASESESRSRSRSVYHTRYARSRSRSRSLSRSSSRHNPLVKENLACGSR